MHLRSWRHKPPSDVEQVLYTFNQFPAMWIILCVVYEDDWLRTASRGCPLSRVPSVPAVSGGSGQCGPVDEELFSGRVQHVSLRWLEEQLACPWGCVCLQEMCQPSWAAGWGPCPLAEAAEQSPV